MEFINIKWTAVISGIKGYFLIYYLFILLSTPLK